MDTITHGIVGALTGKAFFGGNDVPAGLLRGERPHALSSPTARTAIAACTIGSVFPDSDIFAGPVARNPLAIMEWHRNITHSLVLLPLWALLLAALSFPLGRWLRWKLPRFWTLFVIYAAALGTHIVLDLATSFGTMVWSPLRYSRPAWDWVFIVDFTLTTIALAPQLAAWCYREPDRFGRRSVGIWGALASAAFCVYLLARAVGYGFPLGVAVGASAVFALIVFLPALGGRGFRWTRARWCRAGFALACAYIAIAAVAHHRALADTYRYAEAQRLPEEKVAALPLPPTFTHWAGLIGTPSGVWRVTFHEPSGATEDAQFYSSDATTPFIEQARQLRDVQVYLWFARYPVWREQRAGDNSTVVDIMDVRFFRDASRIKQSSPLARVPDLRPNRRGFTFEIVFGAEGQVLAHGFKEPE